MASHDGRSSVGLAPTDADRVIPLRDDRIAVFRDHAQITWLQVEMDLLACTSFEMDTLEITQSNARGSLGLRKLEIELHNFVTRRLAGIGDRDISADRLAGGNGRRGNTEIAIAELRVAEPEVQ